VTVSRNLTHDVKADVADALVPLGLRRRKIGFLTCDLNSECVGSISLGTASEGTPHARRVWPKVGVRHQEAERIVAYLQGEVPHQYLPPTITTELGYTFPGNRWIEWAFGEGEDCSLQVADIREVHEANRWIGATAMALGVDLISGDAVFEHVPGLVVHRRRRDEPSLSPVACLTTAKRGRGISPHNSTPCSGVG
jgi:hypothetical protein